jgi:hypothetical protein
MDSSQLTRYRASHSATAFYERQQRGGEQDPTSIREGGRPLLLRGQAIIPAIIPIATEIPFETSITDSNIRAIITQACNLLLEWIIATKKGPTITARVLYLWAMIPSTAWSWVQSGVIPLSGTHGSWNWDTRSANSLSRRDTFVWLTHALADLMEGAFTGLNASSLRTYEQGVFRWSQREDTEQLTAVRQRGNWSDYLSAWTTWITARASDGSVTAIATQPTTSQVPNIDSEIQTDSATFPTLPNPATWTPLKIPSKARQKYLTFSWDSVQSTGITEGMEQSLDAVADSHYITGSARDTEMDEVMTLTGTLTDTQKVIAEFWAGGPNTVTPPGMMMWFWQQFVSAQSPSVSTAIFSGLDLAIHLFEGSRVTWRNKARKNQSRPIQEIRLRHGGETLTSWNGTPVDGALWTPYQEIDFVTPPFADFPSGHSHFSQAFANTMTAWFGASVPATRVTKTTLSMLSPAFAGTGSQIGTLGEYTFPAGKSQIQMGIVPASAVNLAWSTWQDMANSAGESRLFGGIHCLSAHNSSQAIANELHTQLETVWGFTRA